MPQVALVEQVVDRERRGQQPELVDPRARPLDLGGLRVTLPELRLEVAAKVVLDHEAGGSEWQQPVEHSRGERAAAGAIRAALHRREPHRVAGVREHDVGE